MASALLSQITKQIKTLFLNPSAPSSSFDQPPSHTLKLREDLEALQRMVQRIQAVLTDAERREIHDESVKHWLRELSCLAYDADDVLDDYNYLVLRAQVEAGIQSDGASPSPPRKLKHPQEKVNFLTMVSSSSSDGTTWNKLADRMRKIRLRFEEISYQREALHLREGDVRARQNEPVRPPSSHLADTPTIFGREEIMEEVISMLLSLPDGGEKRTLSVLPIVGMGGVGKTTLVQHVYNDQRVCGRFPSRAWVCVSDDFAVDSLTKRIFESLTGEACQLNEFDAIQKKLIQELEKGKRSLVVLDDVWNETSSFWKNLLKPFRSAGVGGSAVILTTRIESIARMVETMPFRPLGCLSDDTCWLIFEENVFPGRDPADHDVDLVQTGKKIVEKCKGLPLAVQVLASLLRNEFDCDRWEEILQSEVWDVPAQHDEMIPALVLSYHHLPSHLKPCFLYASVFPKDYKFRKEQLVRLWMAQGFLQRKGRTQVEDIGNMYFDDLMQRSLFSLGRASVNEEEYFVMHDLIHDLARHVSQGEISSFTGNEKVDNDKFFPVGGSKVVRHLSISHQGNKGIEWMIQCLCSNEARVIRSLLVVPPCRCQLPNEMILNLESLRALDLSSVHLSELPDSMGYLRHLRHLNLERIKRIRRLPETIGMLYNLQVLNLKGCRCLRSLPESIGGLCNLQHLSLYRCVGLESLPKTFGRLCNLQHLSLDHCVGLGSLPKTFGGLCNLQHLSLDHCVGLKSLPETFGGMCNLQHLSLDHCVCLRSLPKSMGGLCNLRYLGLNDCKALRSLPESFGGLCNLQHLILDYCDDLESLPESIRGLCNLQHLNLNHCQGLRSLPESIGGLCNLQQLSLDACVHLRSLPESIGGLCNLQHLILDHCWDLESLPESIGGLCNLQHLSLDYCKDLRSLPESIGGLCNLRYLKLNFCERLRSLPESIGGLCNLQCLEIENYDLSYPRGMCRLINLCLLVGFTVASRRRGSGDFNRMDLLKDMVHLRGVFRIDGLANVVNPEDAAMANLRNKEHIRQLYLDWEFDNGDNDVDNEKAYHVLENLQPPNGLEELVIRYYKGIRFPSCMGGDASSFSRLTRVQLLYCRRCTLLPPLGLLPSLKHLHIWDVSSVERVGPEFRGMGFPALEELDFSRMPSWVTWDAAERGDFPRLRRLRLFICPKLQSMVPVYLFPSLQQLEIEGCASLPSIELKMRPSSSSSSIGPPPLVKITIRECPLARFSPEDDPLLLPATLQDFSTNSGCPLLSKWWWGDDGKRRLAHIPPIRSPKLEIASVRNWSRPITLNRKLPIETLTERWPNAD